MNHASTPEPLLRVNGIGKSFNGTWVLQDVDFDIRPGEVHALMGENGAGKSTFMKILAGVYAPDDGVVTVGGEPVRFSSPAQALASGIGIIHQELNVIPDMSIADNLALGEEPTRGLGILDRRKVLADARPSWPAWVRTSIRANQCVACRSVCSRWSRSPVPSPRSPGFSSLTSRRPP